MKINWFFNKQNLVRHGSLLNGNCFVWNNSLYMKTGKIGTSLNLCLGILNEFDFEDMVELVECEINVLREVKVTNG